jgi:hypothetical protein
MDTTTTQAGVSRTGRSHGRGEHHTSLPHPPRRVQGLTQAPAAPLPGRCGGALGPVFLAIHPMASASLCCPIRQVVVHVYPGSTKVFSEPRLTLHLGRRA